MPTDSPFWNTVQREAASPLLPTSLVAARDADTPRDRATSVPASLTFTLGFSLACSGKSRQVSRPGMTSSLSLATPPPHVEHGCWSLVQASLSLLYHQGWRLCTLALRRRMFAPCRCAFTLVANGPAHFQMLSTRWKNTPCTTPRSRTTDHAVALA